ncbi:MAG TPA: pitrilysin family protein [Vicinamibacterales bacterium]|nr:pitrilysin family protein [Vicinamibacterales bacterium]
MAVSRLELAVPAVRETVLNNGLKVLVQEVHTAPLASVWCWYKVGSKDERPGLTGVSHWVEHMNFKGTHNIPRDQVKGIIEQFGGTWNGYTWIDQTTYLETASRDALDRMLFIEAERMSSCLYTPEDCESERTVIISELKGGENDPEQLLDIELTAAAFRVHPYQHPTIGWLHDLETMTRDDLYGHYRRYYIPNNATLVIVGDVDTDEVLRRVDHHFGRIASGAAVPRVHTIEPQQPAERRVHFRKEGTTAYWRAAFHAPSVTDEDFLPMLFVDATLSGASGVNLWSGHKVPTPQRSARLYRRVVDSGLASAVGGAILPTEHPFLYYIWATVAEGQTLQAVEEAVLPELDRLAREGVTEAELTKVRTQLRARFVYDSDSVTDIAHQLGYFETIGGWQTYRDLLPRLATVTLDQVNAAARRYLTADNRTIGWFEPQTN